MVSIGAFRVAEGRIRLGDRFYRLVNPERDIPPSSIKIHGIVPDMVAGVPKAAEVFHNFLVFLGADILVAHHAGFDLHFLNELMRQTYGFSLQNLVLDTVLMCRKIAFPPHPYPYGLNLSDGRHSLGAIAKHFGIEIQHRHTALGDALATAIIFQRILALLEKKGNDRLRTLVRVAGVF